MSKFNNLDPRIKKGWIAGVIILIIGLILSIINFNFLLIPIMITAIFDASLVIFNEYLTVNYLNTKGIRIILFIVGILMFGPVTMISLLMFI